MGDARQPSDGAPGAAACRIGIRHGLGTAPQVLVPARRIHARAVAAGRAQVAVGPGRPGGLDLGNALIPIVTGFPAAFIGAFFTGALLIETLFSLDGLGLLSYDSVIRRDYPVVLGTLYLFTLIGLVTKLVSDLCYVWVDPRVRFD
jgi:hypothetical protein